MVVAHPGTQHSARLASALRDAGYLSRYLTSAVWRREGTAARSLRRFRGRWPRYLEQLLDRRSEADIGPQAVQVLPGLELLHVAAARAGLRRISRRALWLRNELFDRRVAEQIERERPAAVICYDTCALRTFRVARRVGTLTVLDQSVGHLRSGIAMLREEGGQEHGRTSATIPDWLVERCSAEATEADLVLAPSAYVELTLVAHGVDPPRIVRMPFGVDVERFRPAGTCDATGLFRVLFVGRLSQRKGIRYLLEAFATLGLRGVELMLVGGVEDARALEAYQGCFRHVSHVSHGEVHRLFQEADVFVYPSLHEGSALATYEALASGLPVITTFNSGSVVRDGVDGFIVPIRDPAAIREKLLLLYQQPGLRRTMGKHARQRAQMFTWDAYRQRLTALLDDVLAQQGSSSDGGACARSD